MWSMLRELHIANLAIIENVHVELAGGLNVFTGQTGAGKSLILGALELLLGLRSGGQEAAGILRPGAEEARVTGVFEISSPRTAERLADILDQPILAEEPILITRRLFASGRSSVSANGTPITAGMLRDAGEFLVDIHGQNDQQVLLKQANQRDILDAYAGTEPLRAQFAKIYHTLRANHRKRRALTENQRDREEKLDLYRFQMEEIDAAAPTPGEFDEARQRHAVLENAAQLLGESAEVVAMLSEHEDSVLDRLGRARKILDRLAGLDDGLSDTLSQVDQAEALLQDASYELARYQDRLEVEPGELQAVEKRLDVLNKLIHKYARQTGPGEDALAAVLTFREEIGRKAEELQHDAETLATLDATMNQQREELGRVGRELGNARRAAGEELKSLVEQEFRELEMTEATFEVGITTRAPDDRDIDAGGLDEIEFLVRTNPGQEKLPLRKIASGGEVARIMLALKTILADKDQVSVLVFDEIDANIGDRLGATIGRKMRALAHGRTSTGKKARKAAKTTAGNGAGHQIICITHLSQIAAHADHHLRIHKEIVAGDAEKQTVTQVTVLDGEDRVRELAEMMAGREPTDATLAHARDLLGRAGTSAKP